MTELSLLSDAGGLPGRLSSLWFGSLASIHQPALEMTYPRGQTTTQDPKRFLPGEIAVRCIRITTTVVQFLDFYSANRDICGNSLETISWLGLISRPSMPVESWKGSLDYRYFSACRKSNALSDMLRVFHAQSILIQNEKIEINQQIPIATKEHGRNGIGTARGSG